MPRAVSCLGLLVFVAVAWLLSENRRRVSLRLVLSGIALQFVLASLLLGTEPGRMAFHLADRFVRRMISFSDAGAAFVFGANFREHAFAFSVLPTIIFISSAMAILFHLGIMQRVVRAMAWVMARVMNTSGSESLAAAAEVFVGNTESPLVIRPYLDTMTRSEIMALMTTGMATVAGGVMAAYVAMGIDAGHLMSASLMAAPAALVVAKIMVPETESSPTKGTVRLEVVRGDANVFDAACRGAGEGLKLALNVAAMLIAFYALIHGLNWLLTFSGRWGGPALSLERMLGWVGAPAAWLLGIEWQDATTIGALFGKKVILNEFVAYEDLVRLRAEVAPRSFTLATYALCGFANFASVGVAIGGLGSLVPHRRHEFARYGLRALIGGTLATFMTAAIAGILLGP